MARKKSLALPVPETRAAAAELAAEYVSADRRMLEIKVGYELQIDRLKAERDRILAGLATEQNGRFAQLKAWWEAGGKALAGKKRSAEFAGAQIGTRLTPPAVKFAKGVKAETIVDWLRSQRWARAKEFFRTKFELDKPAIIKATGAEEDVLIKFRSLGVTVGQIDEFFIDTGLSEEDARQRLAAPNTAAGEVA